MDRTNPAEALVNVAAALAVALVLTPMVRSVTIGLEDTVGQAWPFALTRCHVPSTPGCWPIGKSKSMLDSRRLQAGR